MHLDFHKYQGTGNDFVVIDNRDNHFDRTNNQLVAQLCDRRFGVGADGLMLLQNHPAYDFEMVYYNADGFEGSMCGNGGRCLVQFAHDLGVIGDTTTFIAVDGEHEAFLENGLVHLKMIPVLSIENNDSFDYMDTGSPHYVTYVNDLESFDVFTEGRNIRYNERFKKVGTNVNFVQETGDNSLRVRTYERGVENETLSCGTGVTACALSASLKGYLSPIQLKVQGGQLAVSFEKTTRGFDNIYLIGPAVKVFEGRFLTCEQPLPSNL